MPAPDQKYNLPSDFVPTTIPKEVRVIKELNTIDGIQARNYNVESAHKAPLQPAPVTQNQPIEFRLTKDFVGKRSETFDFNVLPFDPIIYSNTLTETLYAFGGMALAAPQVGHMWRIIALRGLDSALFNPTIVRRSEERSSMQEADLCYPGATADIDRAQAVRVRYLDAFGQFKQNDFAGITARLIQQAVDHLDGKVFLDYLSDFGRKRVLNKASKRNK